MLAQTCNLEALLVLAFRGHANATHVLAKKYQADDYGGVRTDTAKKKFFDMFVLFSELVF